MTQQGPNAIELYEGAVQKMILVLSGIKPDQLSLQTPCDKWNIHNLINHNLQVAQFAHSVLLDVEPDNAGSLSEPLPDQGAEEAFRSLTDRVLAELKMPGKLERILDTPFGTMSAGNFMMMPFSDILIHQWDLARGAGLDTAIDSSLAEVSFQALSKMVEGGRRGGLFGAEVSVPITASIQDKLLALSGRQP